jgi:hypothetical protein
MTSITHKVRAFNVDAPDYEAQYANVLRTLKCFSPERDDIKILYQILANKVGALDRADPRYPILTTLYDKIIYGVDFEYEMEKFSLAVTLHLNGHKYVPHIEKEIQAVATDLKFESTIIAQYHEDDIMTIGAVLRTAQAKLSRLRTDAELVDYLNATFKDVFREYDALTKLDTIIVAT